MTYLISVLAFILIIALCLVVHWKIVKLKTVDDYEEDAAIKFYARSHRLAARRLEIDLMPQSHAKLAAHDEWLEQIYAYMEDYEINVADEMVKGKFSGIKAYGGVRLV